MTKHMRGVHVAQVPKRAMLVMSVLIVPISLSLLFTQSANALPLGVDKLLDGAIPVVTQLLPGSNQPSQPSGNPSNASTTPAASQSQGAANQSSSPAVTPTVPASTTSAMDNEVQTLEPIALIDTADMTQPFMPLGQLASMRGDPSSRTMLARTTANQVVPIQASEDGWRLFGMAWYWWLLIGGGLGYGIRYFMVLHRQKYLAYITK